MKMLAVDEMDLMEIGGLKIMHTNILYLVSNPTLPFSMENSIAEARLTATTQLSSCHRRNQTMALAAVLRD